MALRLTTFTDYSLRVLIYLAAPPERRATIAQVAAAFRISEHHLVKVVHFLGRQGVLRNIRGHGGGLQLARPPKEINIGRVVRLTEGGDVPAECFDEQANTCALAGACRLQRALGEGVSAFYRALERYTLEDLRMAPARLSSALSRRLPWKQERSGRPSLRRTRRASSAGAPLRPR